MPWFLRLVTIVRARSMSAKSELSVISITSRSAGNPLSERMRTIRCASQPSASCSGEMLTEILIFGSQSAASRSASPMTCSESRPMSPPAPRVIHSNVGAPQKIGDACIGGTRRGDTGKCAYLDDLLFEEQRSSHRLENRLGQFIGAAHVVGGQRQCDGELVAA